MPAFSAVIAKRLLVGRPSFGATNPFVDTCTTNGARQQRRGMHSSRIRARKRHCVHYYCCSAAVLLLAVHMIACVDIHLDPDTPTQQARKKPPPSPSLTPSKMMTIMRTRTTGTFSPPCDIILAAATLRVTHATHTTD